MSDKTELSSPFNKEQTLMKSEGVKDCVKWIKKKIKEEKEQLKIAVKDEKSFGMYDDCGPAYRREVERTELRIQSLVEVKISLEKYMKLLRHSAKE